MSLALTPWASGLVAAAAVVVGTLGALHLFFTFKGRRFEPHDAALLQRLQEVSPRISRETTLWRAGLGFHASHSLGALLWALVFADLALAHGSLFFKAPVLLGLGAAWLLAMLVLAWRYWFRVPLIGLASATVLYAAGVMAALL